MEFRRIFRRFARSTVWRRAYAAVAVNVRAYLRGSYLARTLLTDAILTVSAAIQTIHRLNDSTPAGPQGRIHLQRQRLRWEPLHRRYWNACIGGGDRRT